MWQEICMVDNGIWLLQAHLSTAVFARWPCLMMGEPGQHNYLYRNKNPAVGQNIMGKPQGGVGGGRSAVPSGKFPDVIER